MQTRSWWLALIFALTVLVNGQALAVEDYEKCLALVDQAPAQALDEAQGWADLGGGVPARHCRLLALKRLGHYADAAAGLEDLARAPGAGDAPNRAELLAQAGNAWILQHEPARAFAALSEALRLRPRDRDILIDRARAAALGEDYRSARMDLDQVLAQAPVDIDALVLRAAARRLLGDLAGAKADANLAITKAPNVPDAWIERGLARFFMGDQPGARSDWTKAQKLAPNSQAGLDAQALLEREVNRRAIEGPAPAR